MVYRHQIATIRTNRALIALLLSNSLILISLGMFVPIYALFVQKVGGGALSAGFTAGALAFASAFSALIAGKVIDKFPKSATRNFLTIGWALIGLVMLAYILVSSILALLVVQILAGLIKTISAPAFDTLYARNLDSATAGQEYGIWEASFFVTAGIGSMLGGIIVYAFGFNGVFITMALLAFMAAGYIATLPKHVL